MPIYGANNRSEDAVNPYCDYCGARLEMDELRCWGECPRCGETKTQQAMAEEPDPGLLHGIRCNVCDGEGYVEVDQYERHPYGDSYAVEALIDVEDCPYCGGDGCDKDEDSCIVCGEPVTNGWNLHGWEVHEGCHDGEIPKGINNGQPL